MKRSIANVAHVPNSIARATAYTTPGCVRHALPGITTLVAPFRPLGCVWNARQRNARRARTLQHHARPQLTTRVLNVTTHVASATVRCTRTVLLARRACATAETGYAPPNFARLTVHVQMRATASAAFAERLAHAKPPHASTVFIMGTRLALTAVVLLAVGAPRVSLAHFPATVALGCAATALAKRLPVMTEPAMEMNPTSIVVEQRAACALTRRRARSQTTAGLVCAHLRCVRHPLAAMECKMGPKLPLIAAEQTAVLVIPALRVLHPPIASPRCASRRRARPRRATTASETATRETSTAVAPHALRCALLARAALLMKTAWRGIRAQMTIRTALTSKNHNS